MCVWQKRSVKFRHTYPTKLDLGNDWNYNSSLLGLLVSQRSQLQPPPLLAFESMLRYLTCSNNPKLSYRTVCLSWSQRVTCVLVYGMTQRALTKCQFLTRWSWNDWNQHSANNANTVSSCWVTHGWCCFLAGCSPLLFH